MKNSYKRREQLWKLQLFKGWITLSTGHITIQWSVDSIVCFLSTYPILRSNIKLSENKRAQIISIIIHWRHYLNFEWLQARSEFLLALFPLRHTYGQ